MRYYSQVHWGGTASAALNGGTPSSVTCIGVYRNGDVNFCEANKTHDGKPAAPNPAERPAVRALAAEPGQAFVRLRTATGLTDGNLATHARRLASARFF